MPTVAFVGLGKMGRGMAGCLLDAGCSVHIRVASQGRGVWGAIC